MNLAEAVSETQFFLIYEFGIDNCSLKIDDGTSWKTSLLNCSWKKKKINSLKFYDYGLHSKNPLGKTSVWNCLGIAYVLFFIIPFKHICKYEFQPVPIRNENFKMSY